VPNELADVRAALLAWYAGSKRDFPWRRTSDPYAVLVSEVMLQQTQASRVVERFPRFMARFPTAQALADADAADVLVEWSGLGYNRRAVALQAAAIHVAARGWPRDVETLQRLPGVGPYTARAIASLAFGVPAGVVDTNVRRWVTRRFGVETRRELQSLADALASAGDPADAAPDAASWTHAGMEFGATICRSRRPACHACPIADGCPSAGADRGAPSRRTPVFRGSRRAYRGALLRALTAAPRRRLRLTDGARQLADRSPSIGPALSGEQFSEIVRSLVDDGLAVVEGRELRLGSHRPLESPSARR
jgi:A/G-specific adenine glycosylase